MVNALRVEHVEQLRQGSAGAHDGEEREEDVPRGQVGPQLEPRPRAHDVLTDEDEEEVDGGRVGADGPPVVLHPGQHLGVFEAFLEAEEEGVVHRGVVHRRQVPGHASYNYTVH